MVETYQKKQKKVSTVLRYMWDKSTTLDIVYAMSLLVFYKSNGEKH